MLPSLDAATSGLDQFQQEINVIANNIANVDTVGFKSANINFEDTMSMTLGSNAAGSMQVGTGVTTASIANQFTQGTISSNGVPTDLAVDGNGFFLVKDPTSGNLYATRDGDFKVDSNGYLVTSTGERVQGYTDSTDATVGDIQITNAGAPNGDTSTFESCTFDSSGNVNILLADGTQYKGGQVLLQNFSDPGQLMNAGNNLFTGLSLAGPLPAPVAPGSNGLGTLATSSLEMSNVDLSDQLSSLIVAQRAYEANAKVVTTSDEILQDVTNLKR